MPMHQQNAAEPFVQRLETFSALSSDEKQAIRELPLRAVDIKPDQDITRQGDSPTRMFFIIEGMTCTYKMALESKRQIVAFHMQGDAPDLLSLHLTRLDAGISTITPCRIAFVNHSDIRKLCANHPRIISALWRQTLIDAAIFREWMTSIGQRPAASRIAHLLCELFVRARAVGLADGNSISMPVTQAEIGDALGMSSVHVNRSLQELRGKDYITLKNAVLEILDWEGLQRAGDFSADYLYLREEDE